MPGLWFWCRFDIQHSTDCLDGVKLACLLLLQKVEGLIPNKPDIKLDFAASLQADGFRTKMDWKNVSVLSGMSPGALLLLRAN